MRAFSSARGLPPKLLFFISLTWSCMLLDPPLQFGSPRTEDRHLGISSSGAGKERQDTLPLVSAIDFPLSYDWQRDSACGNVSCTLRLFRGDEEALSIPAGPGTTVSAAPDGHHIIGGDLYTCFADSRGTFIGRNGTTVAHWEGKEYIVGLLPAGGGLFTLGLCPDGGLVFRCDGREFYKDPDSVPFGGFGSDTYGSAGALYSDGGGICFACLRNAREVVFVRDGEEDGPAFSPSAADILDARYIDGGKYVLYNQAGYTMEYDNGRYCNISQYRGIRCTDAGLMELDGKVCFAGQCFRSETHSECWGIGWGYEFRLIDGEPERLYFDGSECFPLYPDAYPGCRFFGRSCGAVHGGSLALALTPRDGSPPFVQFQGVRTEYPIHGFLSGISFILPE